MVEKDLGFVLKRHNFRDTSIIASLYTLRFGRITGIFKGFYTMKKEFSSSLDVFTLNEFLFYPRKREIWLVSFADLIFDWPYLRKDISKSKVAAVFFNLIQRTMQMWDVNAEVFHLLKESLLMIEREDERKVLYIFLIKFLALSGFKPELNHCLSCHQELFDNIYFSVSKGGFLCKDCYLKINDAQKISRQVSSSLLYLQKQNFSMALRLKPAKNCESNILYLLRNFLAYHLDLDISHWFSIDNSFLA